MTSRTTAVRNFWRRIFAAANRGRTRAPASVRRNTSRLMPIAAHKKQINPTRHIATLPKLSPLSTLPKFGTFSATQCASDASVASTVNPPQTQWLDVPTVQPAGMGYGDEVDFESWVADLGDSVIESEGLWG